MLYFGGEKKRVKIDMDRVLVKAENLSHRFDYLLYENINLQIREGESIAIVGRSGSGKSTLLHTLSGFLPPLGGRVMMMEQDLYTLSESAIDELRRKEVGIVFQMHYLFKGMSAMDNIEIATLLAEKETDKEILKSLQIDDIVHKRVGELSGGQQQRVSIARVLSKKPHIIFADEPTGNLDTETSTLVMNTMIDYIKDVSGSMLLVTHDIEVAKMCDAIYKMDNKTLVEVPK